MSKLGRRRSRQDGLDTANCLASNTNLRTSRPSSHELPVDTILILAYIHIEPVRVSCILSVRQSKSILNYPDVSSLR